MCSSLTRCTNASLLFVTFDIRHFGLPLPLFVFRTSHILPRGNKKEGALIPRRQPSPRSVVFRRRPENKVFRLVARQNPFTEGVLAAPPVPLKVKAADTAHICPMKSQYRLPINLFWGRCSGKLRFLSEKPFVCLMHFRETEMLLFCLTGRQSSALICASHCLTCVPETREKGWRNRVHTNVGALCAVERANAVKAPRSS